MSKLWQGSLRKEELSRIVNLTMTQLECRWLGGRV